MSAGINELIASGYMARRAVRDDKGHFQGYEYVVYEIPFPKPGFPATGFPYTDNPALLTTDVTNEPYNQLQNKVNGTSSDVRDGGYDPDVVRFFDWYTQKCYPHFKAQEHPRLSKAQRERVLSALSGFAHEKCLDIDALCEMANVYFADRALACDHNINHFATEGILLNRYYDAGLL